MYVVEADDVLLAMFQVGEMTAWIETIPLMSFHLYTVWYVDEETGRAVRVSRERA